MEQNKILINEFLVKDSIRIAKDMQELAMEILPIAELINTTKSNLENYAQKCDILSKDGDLESNTLYLEFLAIVDKTELEIQNLEKELKPFIERKEQLYKEANILIDKIIKDIKVDLSTEELYDLIAYNMDLYI